MTCLSCNKAACRCLDSDQDGFCVDVRFGTSWKLRNVVQPLRDPLSHGRRVTPLRRALPKVFLKLLELT